MIDIILIYTYSTIYNVSYLITYFVRSVDIEQPDFQWQYQLRHERDVTAQTEAVYALERFPTPATRAALTHIIENENCFYRVRCRATHCLTKVEYIFLSV